ncbi:MAG: hypothetical protein HC769_37690 [Cyanobacteria bacterium CRU_2_1]|nr:hypothetical protein [Cyanobacteria bacterium CRU_2_1]
MESRRPPPSSSEIECTPQFQSRPPITRLERTGRGDRRGSIGYWQPLNRTVSLQASEVTFCQGSDSPKGSGSVQVLVGLRSPPKSRLSSSRFLSPLSVPDC